MKAPVPSRRTVIVLAWLVGIVILLAVIWLSARVATLSQEVDDAEERATTSAVDRGDLRHIVEQQSSAIAAANERLVELGAEPVTPPPAALPMSPLQGPRGFPGPAGPQGRPGPRGASCTEELGLRTCRGDEGATGQNGATGTAGQSGEQGPKGEQGPAGPQGDRGPEGPAGPPGVEGRGITKAVCGDDGRWAITYTDGTTADGGVCRAPLAPNGENP